MCTRMYDDRRQFKNHKEEEEENVKARLGNYFACIFVCFVNAQIWPCIWCNITVQIKRFGGYFFHQCALVLQYVPASISFGKCVSLRIMRQHSAIIDTNRSLSLESMNAQTKKITSNSIMSQVFGLLLVNVCYYAESFACRSIALARAIFSRERIQGHGQNHTHYKRFRNFS